MKAITMALGDVGRNRMPITYALRMKSVLSSLNDVAEDVDKRLKEMFDEYAEEDGTMKQGSASHAKWQAQVNDYLNEPVTLEIPPEPIPISVLMEKDIEITPVALETLLKYEVFSE